MLAGFLLFIVLRSFHPEIIWGEKTMDLSFLNYMIRLETLPPDDPWAVGQKLDYYYLGYYLFAMLHKLTGISANVGYNLAVATLPALMLAACYSVVIWLCRKRWLACLAALAVTLMSNLEAVYVLWSERNTGWRITFDGLFWKTRSIFTPPTFAEYPLWSNLFADLHPHMIALPFTVVVIGLGLRLLKPEKACDPSVVLHRLLYALAWGTLFVINSWDFITYGLVTILFLFYRPLRQSGDRPVSWSDVLLRIVTRVFELAAIGVVAYLAVWPFMGSTAAGSKLHYNWVQSFELNNLWQVARHLGAWLVVVFVSLGLVLLRCRWTLKWQDLGRYAVALLMAGLPVGLAIWSSASGIKALPWPIVFLGSALVFGAVLVGWRAQSGRSLRAVAALLTASGFMIVGAELVFLLDRMNTIFKFYNAIWILLGLAGGGLSLHLFQVVCARRYARRASGIGVRVLGVAVVATIVCGFIGSVLNMYVMVTHRRIDGPRPVLNGTAYLKQHNPEEAALVTWINSHIQGTPTVLEAQGGAYQLLTNTRICKHTGLPTVLGWEHHVSQRGTDRAEINRRVRDIRQIYTMSDARTAYDLLERYNVSLIVVGESERKAYSTTGLRKFVERSDLFPVLFRVGDTSLYTTAYALRGAQGTGRFGIKMGK